MATVERCAEGAGLTTETHQIQADSMTTPETSEAWAPPPDGKLKLDEPTLAYLRRLGVAMFSEIEAAAAMGVTAEHMTEFLKRKKARQAYHAGRAGTLETLRLAQFKHAQTNASMALFLGRTYSGQGEQREGEDGAAAFDFSGAGRRLRDKLAALAAAGTAGEDQRQLSEP